MTNPQREIEQRAKAVLKCTIAVDLAANVPDDAAKPDAQEFKLSLGALELMRVGIAPDHDGGALGQAQIALAQLDALALGQIDQLLDCPVGEPGVGRMCDRFLLHGGVHHNPFEILGLDRPGPMCHRKALLQQRRNLFLTQPLAPARQRRAIERCRVLEHHFAAEILKIRVLHPAVAQRLIGEVVHVLEDQQSGHQPCWQWWLPRPDATDRTEASGQELPIDLRRQTDQRMAKVDDLLQRGPKQIILTIVAGLAHGSPPTANPAVKRITNRLNPESQNARKPIPTPVFLQISILAKLKLQRCIPRFRILHGRLKNM
jgi:hypothetical protein